MTRFRKSMCVALALAGVVGAATFGDPVPSGRQVFELRCRACHGGTPAPDVPLGPNLEGIIGTRAGTKDSGLHSRAVIDSGTVWNRESLRRFLSEPGREIPGTLMPVRVTNPAELENLLDYLESLR